MKRTTVFDCSVIEIDKHLHEKGNLSVVEIGITAPFQAKRVFYLYDVPGGEARGGHAHKELTQFIFAASGSFDITLYDGESKRTVSLNRPYRGLLILPGIWGELDNFSSGSVCLVLASDIYSEHDYIRSLEDFKLYKSKKVAPSP